MLRLAAFLALALPGAAGAVSCDSHDGLAEALSRDWGEVRQGVGLQTDGAMLELYASGVSGTWTVVVTRAGEASCIVAAGGSWETDYVPPEVPTGEPA